MHTVSEEMKKKILSILKDEPSGLTAKVLTKKLKFSFGYVYASLNKLVEEGKLDRSEKHPFIWKMKKSGESVKVNLAFNKTNKTEVSFDREYLEWLSIEEIAEAMALALTFNEGCKRNLKHPLNVIITKEKVASK